MTRRRRILIILVLIGLSAGFLLHQFSFTREIEKRVMREMEAAGLTHTEVHVASVDNTHVTFSQIAFNKDKMRVVAKEVTILTPSLPYAELLQGKFDTLAGEWSVGSIEIENAPYPLPPLKGTGQWNMKNKVPYADGSFASADKTYHASFILGPNEVRMQQVRLPWQGARLSVKEMRIPLGTLSTLRIPLYIEKMPLSALLALATGDKASGTGEVSGHVPLIIAPDGKISLGAGKLSTQQNGIVSLAPELLAGDAPQMEMARMALSNFHYTDVRLTSDNGKDGRPTIHLSLKGSNPNAFSGREINLNVNLTGDVLEALQSTLQLMNDSTAWIEQETK